MIQAGTREEMAALEAEENRQAEEMRREAARYGGKGEAKKPATVPDKDAGLLRPSFMSARQLMIAHPKLRPPVIHGLLREGESINIIAPPKRGKSWLINDLALCIATGTPWFEQFNVERGDVLIIDNELHKETIANRLPKIAEAKGLKRGDWEDRICIESLRGRIADLYQLASYFAAIKPGRFKVVIVDAWYRVQPRDMSENANGELAGLYNQIDRYAADINSAFALIHHSSKGNQSEKSVTDVGSGGSAQARAADTHLVMRNHEEDDAVVVQAEVRSFQPVKPMCLRWHFPLWAWAPELDPAKLQKAGRKKKDDEPEEEPWSVERFATTFIMGRPMDKNVIVSEANKNGLSKTAAKEFVVQAETQGLAYRWRAPGKTVLLANAPEPQDWDPRVYVRTPHTPQENVNTHVLVGGEDTQTRAHTGVAQ